MYESYENLMDNAELHALYCLDYHFSLINQLKFHKYEKQDIQNLSW